MAQATTQQTQQTNNNTTTNGNGAGKREAKPMTAIDAISKISKILEQLSLTDRKRVLAFVNESSDESTP